MEVKKITQKHSFEKQYKTFVLFKIKLFNFFKYFNSSFQIFLFPKLDIGHENSVPSQIAFSVKFTLKRKELSSSSDVLNWFQFDFSKTGIFFKEV